MTNKPNARIIADNEGPWLRKTLDDAKRSKSHRERSFATPTVPNTECDVCHQEPCCCNGIQTYAMSNYPGEHRMVESHPGNIDSEQWYRREDVDVLLKKLHININEKYS